MVATSLLLSTCSMGLDIYIANHIGSETIGLFGLIMVVYQFAMTIANSGISLASTRIVAEEAAMSSAFSVFRAMKKCIFYSFLGGCLAGLLLCFFAPLACQLVLHQQISPRVFYFLAISLPFSGVAIALMGYFTGIKRISRNSCYDIANFLFKLLGVWIGFTYFPVQSIENICCILGCAISFSEICSFLLILFLYRLEQKKIRKTQRSSANYQRILKIALPVAVTSYLRSGLSTIKQSIIPVRLEKSGLSCQQALSQYGLVQGMVMPILMFPSVLVNSISLLMIPEFARYRMKQDWNRMREIILLLFRCVILFSFCIIGIFLLFPDQISFLTYHTFSLTPYLLLLAPLLFWMHLDHVIDAVLKGIDRQVGVMFCNIFDLFISIFLLYILIPRFGMIGYIMVMYVSEILNFSISCWQLYRATHFRIDFLHTILHPFTALWITVLLFSSFSILTQSFLSTIGWILLFVMVYIGNYLILSFFLPNCSIFKKLKQ